VLLVRGEQDEYATATDLRRWQDRLAGIPVRAESIPLVDHAMVATVPTSASRSASLSDAGPRVPEYLLDMIADFVNRPTERSGGARTKQQR